jgi:hypothetical protein
VFLLEEEVPREAGELRSSVAFGATSDNIRCLRPRLQARADPRACRGSGPTTERAAPRSAPGRLEPAQRSGAVAESLGRTIGTRMEPAMGLVAGPPGRARRRSPSSEASRRTPAPQHIRGAPPWSSRTQRRSSGSEHGPDGREIALRGVRTPQRGRPPTAIEPRAPRVRACSATGSRDVRGPSRASSTQPRASRTPRLGRPALDSAATRTVRRASTEADGEPTLVGTRTPWVGRPGTTIARARSSRHRTGMRATASAASAATAGGDDESRTQLHGARPPGSASGRPSDPFTDSVAHETDRTEPRQLIAHAPARLDSRTRLRDHERGGAAEGTVGAWASRCTSGARSLGRRNRP